MPRWIRPALLVGLVAVGVVVAVAVGIPPLTEIRDWVAAAGWAGPVLYAAVFAGASLTPAPASVLTVGAGALFGWPVGVAVAMAGALVGALVGFGVARRLGRPAAAAAGGEWAARLDRLLRRRGLLAMITIRLLPVAPFAIVNAACGLTAVRLRDYTAGTALGMLPGMAAFVGIGAFGGSPGSAPFLVTVAALVVLIGAGGLLGRRGAAAELAGRSSGGATATRPDDADRSSAR